jgi:hypothetical protein
VKYVVRLTVGLPALTHSQVNDLSRARRVSCSDIVRTAVTDYLERTSANDADQSSAPANFQQNPYRMTLLGEAAQVGIDVLLRELAPEKREEVLHTVEKRLEQFHVKK